MHELVIVVFYFYMVRIGHSVFTSISHMVRNGHSVILFPNWLLSNITYSNKMVSGYGAKYIWYEMVSGYGAKYIWYEIAILWYEMVNYGMKWLWCKIHMVRNGFWLWYEIAILCYEMVNYGTKWQWYEMVMERNDLLRFTLGYLLCIHFKFSE